MAGDGRGMCGRKGWGQGSALGWLWKQANTFPKEGISRGGTVGKAQKGADKVLGSHASSSDIFLRGVRRKSSSSMCCSKMCVRAGARWRSSIKLQEDSRSLDFLKCFCWAFISD